MHLRLRISSIWLAVFIFFVASSGLARGAAGQSTYTAQLSGVVKDSSGGVIPGAKVILSNEATGVGASLSTDSRGIYVFTGVRPGSYSIRVEARGMATQERKGLTLAVSQQATLDLVLSPGKVSESVTVTEQAPLLDTGDGRPHIFLTNFGGLVPSKVAIPVPAKDIHVRIPAAMGNSAIYLPFLGEAQRLQGEKKGNQVEFNLPAVERGAVVWVGETE